MGLHQIRTEDIWSLAWTSLKVKFTKDKKRHFSVLSLASQFMFGKTLLASSCILFCLPCHNCSSNTHKATQNSKNQLFLSKWHYKLTL